MKRWLGLISIAFLAAFMMAAFVKPAAANVSELWIEITDYDDAPAQGSTFNVTFTVHVPSDVTIPSSTPTKTSTIYYSTFFFVGNNIDYPAEGYWWGDYKGSVFWNSSQTTYTVQVKMKTAGQDDSGSTPGEDAPVGQQFYLGIYWKIPLDSAWSNPEGKNLNSLAMNDNIQFRIYGDNTTYTMKIVNAPDVYSNYTKYTISDTAVGDIYVRTDQSEYLYIRALKSGLTVQAAPGFQLPLIPIVGALVALLVVVGVVVVVLKKRGGAAEVPPPPPPPPSSL